MIDIKVTDIGEYVSQDSCAMKFKLRADNRTKELFPYCGEIRAPVDPALNAAGRDAENKLAHILQSKYQMKFLPFSKSSSSTGYSTSWEHFLKYLASAEKGCSIFMREVEISSETGEFVLHGKMDFVILSWSNGPVLRILECKSSRRDKTYHRIQLAAYKMMLEDKLSGGAVIAGELCSPNLEYAVIRAEGSCEIFDPLDTPPLDLENEVIDLKELASPSGPLYQIFNLGIEKIDYALGTKCNMCSHASVCAVESARNKKIELLGLSLSENKILKNAGIFTLDDIISADGECLAACRFSPEFLKTNASAKLAGLHAEGGKHPVQNYSGVIPALPDHKQDNGSLLRIYLNVEWDPLEDRILGAAAHITDSDNFLYLKKDYISGKCIMDPAVRECTKDRQLTGLMNGIEIKSILKQPWTSSKEENDFIERELLEDFFGKLSTDVSRMSDADKPIHFYVWSDYDMRHLVDGCKRAGSVLSSLTELLGCRAECTHNLEQVIYSSLENEVKRRTAVGRISSSLAAVTFFSWYGWDFHWMRSAGGEAVNFQSVFRQDIFDLSTSLLDEGNGLRRNSRGEYYEVRISSDSLISLPYWYIMWGISGKLSSAGTADNLGPYKKGGNAEYIMEFMAAKCQALRWIDERLMPQDLPSGKRMPSLIPQKPALPLREFSSMNKILSERNQIRQACLDFLRLDHKMKEAEWLAENALPAAPRAAEGTCIPLKNIYFTEENIFTAEIDFSCFDADSSKLFEMCEFSEGSFVRILPFTGNEYQLRRGITAIITDLDFDSGTLKADVMGARASSFIMSSRRDDFDDATCGLAVSSLSDFTKDKVFRWLNDCKSPVFDWFNPQFPNIPPKTALPAEEKELCKKILMSAGEGKLDNSQLNACIDALETRIQLLFGPPGTGKTSTMSYAVLLRMIMSRDNAVFLISANTHTAIDELLSRINSNLNKFISAAESAGADFKLPSFVRLSDSVPEEGEMSPRDVKTAFEYMSKGRTAFCGTVNQILKLAKAAQSKEDTFLVDTLIIDEASMMAFPNFLALTSLLDVDGSIMLAGDILQLSPITSYKWDTEQREQIEKLKPYQSAYAAVQALCGEKSPVVRQSALEITYRMNRECTSLISEIYRREGIFLQAYSEDRCVKPKITSFSDIWKGTGIFLILHNEDKSKKYNPFEVSIIQEILKSRLDDDLAVITPHRAQKAAISKAVSGLDVDTVERFQGGQRNTVIVSGTQSDAMEISGNAEFILNLNRTNVIFSRAKSRLIVVCSKNLLDSIPSDAEEYENALLWKRLRLLCSETAFVIRYKDYSVEVKTPPLV